MWLLGDAGYNLEPWLMTPITDAAERSSEARYTQCHTFTRHCVGRTFGVLKNMWRCLLSHYLYLSMVCPSNLIDPLVVIVCHELTFLLILTFFCGKNRMVSYICN